MKPYHTYALFATLIFFIFFTCCTRKIYNVAYPTLSDGKYDTEFPYKDASKQLQEISRTIERINCVAYYKSYVFSESSKIGASEISESVIKDHAIDTIYYSNSTAGTASVIYYGYPRVALLTCAHVVDFPDTVISYHDIEDETSQNYVATISIKERQSNFAPSLAGGGEFEILMMDKSLDLAVLGRTLYGKPENEIAVFDYPLGKAKELDWGTFVYLVGYPRGHKMITKGIVSDPNRDNKGSFLIDAVFNRGFSGGIVLAIRDGVPNFELVGIAKSASADLEYVVTPIDTEDVTYDPHIPYRGNVYVKSKRDIRYGITYSISTETIRKFFRDNHRDFIKKGYDFSALILE